MQAEIEIRMINTTYIALIGKKAAKNTLLYVYTMLHLGLPEPPTWSNKGRRTSSTLVHLRQRIHQSLSSAFSNMRRGQWEIWHMGIKNIQGTLYASEGGHVS
jgi:hypothetical protein